MPVRYLNVPPNRMLKKSASGVLASLRGSTLRKEFLGDRKHWMGCSVRQDLCVWANGPTKCGRYLLAFSLAATLLGTRRVSARRGWEGEKSGLFEHPAKHYPATLEMGTIKFSPCHNSFSADSYMAHPLPPRLTSQGY